MDNEEIVTIENNSTADLIKEAAIKAAAGAVVSILVTALVHTLASKAAKKFKKDKDAIVETTATEA